MPEVLKATRLNLRNGATQIKVMAGGGGSSRFDPIDTTQYSLEELKAIVGAAEDGEPMLQLTYLQIDQ